MTLAKYAAGLCFISLIMVYILISTRQEDLFNHRDQSINPLVVKNNSSESISIADIQASKERDTLAIKIAAVERQIAALKLSKPKQTNEIGKVENLQQQLNALAQVVEEIKVAANSVDSSSHNATQNLQLDDYTVNSISLQQYRTDEEKFTQLDYSDAWSLEVIEKLKNNTISMEQSEQLVSPVLLSNNFFETLDCRVGMCRLEIEDKNMMNDIENNLMMNTTGLFTKINVHYNDSGGAVIFLSTS